MANLSPNKWERKTQVWAVLIAALLVWGGWYSVETRSETRVPKALRAMDNGQAQIVNDAGETITIRGKIARDQQQWASGLLGAGAKTVADTPVIFVATRNTNHRFSARDLRAPVDVAFFNMDGQLMQIQQMVPNATRTYTPTGAYRWAIQARSGYFTEQGISAGNATLVNNSIRTVR